MHSAIIVVAMPNEPRTGAFAGQKWNDFIGDVDSLRQDPTDPLDHYAGVERLSENVWQVNFLLHPQIFVRIVDCAIRHRFPYRILQLDAEPQWLPADQNPKPS